MKYFLILSLFCSSAFAYKTSLSSKEMELLKKGEEVVRVEEVKGEVFPKVTLINIVPHTPEENMKTFTKFETHKNFIPGIVRSKIVKQKGALTDVDFEMHMPMVANSQYITRHIEKADGKDRILTWDLVKSKQLKATKGMLMFEDMGDGKSLFTYVTHVTPDSKFAWVVKDKVVPDTRKTMKVVREYLAKHAGL